jgi:hypothetical protein
MLGPSFAEYWAGHELNDDCPYIDPRRREPRPAHFGGAFRDAKVVLEDFCSNSTTFLIRTFLEGSVFNAKEFGEGSVLRIVGESYRQPILRLPRLLQTLQKPDHEQWNYWAVVTGFDQGDQRYLLIAAFRELGPEFTERFLGWDILDPVIRVGEVSHVKERMRIPFFQDYQRLERPERVEVWGMGKPLRRGVTMRTASEVPGLAWAPGQVTI